MDETGVAGKSSSSCMDSSLLKYLVVFLITIMATALKISPPSAAISCKKVSRTAASTSVQAEGRFK